MNKEQIQIRINQCVENAKASHCVRNKFGAMIVDPKRNVIISDGYNGGPRGGTKLCADIHGKEFCEREGLSLKDFEIKKQDGMFFCAYVKKNTQPLFIEVEKKTIETEIDNLINKYPKILSGQQTELGCIHAEANTILNAANAGNQIDKCWMFVTGEPCLNCAKLIVNSGITKVFIIGNKYKNNGLKYLEKNKVCIEVID